jgi:hypothetical protein
VRLIMVICRIGEDERPQTAGAAVSDGLERPTISSPPRQSRR